MQDKRGGRGDDSHLQGPGYFAGVSVGEEKGGAYGRGIWHLWMSLAGRKINQKRHLARMPFLMKK